MQYIQFMNFEITTECNRAKEHVRCPVSDSGRWTHLDTDNTLDDETIVKLAVQAYTEFGFRGLIGWHYYCEPLLEKERIFKLMAEIRKQVPSARFVLWTNGDLLPDDVKGCEQYKAFEQVYITNYSGKDWRAIKQVVKHVTIIKPKLDARRTAAGTRSMDPCVRPYVEFTIDNHGNVHLCCMDWAGKASPGNIFKRPLEEVVASFVAVREQVAGNAMTIAAPATCLDCQMRFAEITPFDDQICREASMARGWGIHKHLPVRDAAVTFTSYKVPQHRLREHFEWNDELYRALGLKVYVVTDHAMYDVPDYAECVVFTEDMPVFNLARTSNYGIKHAIAKGHEVIIKSDVDICFPELMLKRAIRCRDNEAIIPLYLMSANYPDRRWNYIRAPKAEGTVVMHRSQWQTIHYDERCIGYGAEDGILVHSIKKAKLMQGRDPIVWHIAHVADTEQKEKGGRTDHWNRDIGFNPNKLKRNIKLHPAKQARYGRMAGAKGKRKIKRRR